MGVCIRKRVVYDMSCKRFQLFVNVEALALKGTTTGFPPHFEIKGIFTLFPYFCTPIV